MTYSIGYRAPSHRDMVTYFTDGVAEDRISFGAMYSDPELSMQTNPGLITAAAISKAKDMIRSALLSALDDEHYFNDWFGAYVTQSRRDHRCVYKRTCMLLNIMF